MAQPVEVLTPELRGAGQPQVSVAPNQNIFVTFGKGDLIYCIASSDGCKTFRQPREIANLPKLALGMRRGPRIVASDSQVTVSAVSAQDGNLYAWTSADGDETWSKAVMINSVTNAVREGLHGMAGDRHENVYVVWLDLRNQGTQLWGAGSRDGGRTWSKNVLIYRSPDGHICECCHPSVEVAPNGAVRVMWRNWIVGSRDMYTAISTDGGKTFSAPAKLGLGTWPLNGCPMDGGGLAGPYSIWRRGSAVYYTGNQPGEHLLGEGRQPIIGMSTEGPYFVWEKGPQLIWQKGLATSPTLLTDLGAYPAIAAASEDQSPVVAWESSTNGTKTIFAEMLR